MRILALDPGNEETGYAVISLPEFHLHEFGKVDNGEMMARLPMLAYHCDEVAIEMVACYGMAVGKSVFETCVWIGRFIEALGGRYSFVYRKDEKLCLCGTVKAKDTNVRQALIDRYAKFDFTSGKGTKNNPDTFYGVKSDVWAAIAVGVTHYEKKMEN